MCEFCQVKRSSRPSRSTNNLFFAHPFPAMPSPTASSVARRGLNGLLSLNGCRACGACVASVGSNGTGTPRRPLSTTRLNRAAANEGGTNTNTPHPVSNIPPDDPAHPFLTMSRQARFHPADGSATHAEHQQHGQPMPRTSHPYFSTQLDEYAKKEISPITLKDLLRLGKGQEGLVESGRWLREELPKRLARRVRGWFRKENGTLKVVFGVLGLSSEPDNTLRRVSDGLSTKLWPRLELHFKFNSG